jgi:arylsulfatase A-like enzyme/Tfp pilus assembly protein PilF
MLVCVLQACGRRPELAVEQKPAAAVPKRNINVLLITIDTLRADYLFCYGRKSISTPNIDALAARGARCEQAMAQVPLTEPSHASILTGTYPQVHKVRDMGGFILDGGVPTLATILSDAGWATAAFVGAAALNHNYGMNRGFTVYADSMEDESSLNRLPGVFAEIRGDVVARRALEWLEKSERGKPFFLWVHFYDPHFPYDAPEPYRSRYKKDLYGGEVAYTDEQVGKLLRSLAELRLDSNTLVVLLADHGESLGEHGEYTHGVFLYDSTMHIPLMFAGPGIPGGRVVSQQVRTIDVLPTVTDFLGLPAGEKVQGVSLMPALLEGKATRSNYCYMETLYPRTRMGWSELRAMRTDQWKLVVAPKPELYRLSDDRGETRNVAGKFLADADHLQKKVWEIAGPPKSLAPLIPQPIDDERKRELDALGYVGSGRRIIHIDMSGPDPKDRVAVLTILERAADHMNHDRWKDAAAVLEKVLAEDRTNTLIYEHLQFCYEQLGQFDKMEQAGLRATENGIETDDELAKLAEIYIRRGQLSHAVDFMERVAKINPANLQNMENLATAYLLTGRTGDTERVVRAILVQSPRDATAHNVYGNLEIQRGREGEARQHFEQAIKCDPGLAEPYLNLGLIAQNAGDISDAIAYYRDFLRKADKDKYREYIPKVRAALASLGARPGE